MAHQPPVAWPAQLAALLIGAATMGSPAVANADDSPGASESFSKRGAVATDVSLPSIRHHPWTSHAIGAAEQTGSGSAATTDRAVTLIELSPEWRPGAAPRAHHARGFRSHAAENWLRSQGVGAKTCYLPMLRMPARVTSSGEASVAFWIYARCSFY